MGDLSEHFDSSEFRDHQDHSLKGPAPRLVIILERIRAAIGRPLPIVSGYRSPASNRRAGGARYSRHLVGEAADIPSGLVTVDQAIASGAGGIGVCRGWVVHVDCRTLARPIVFTDCPKGL